MHEEFEAVFREVGEFGVGQFYICAALYLCYVYAAGHVLQLVFTGHEAKFTCNSGAISRDGNATGAAESELTDEEWNERMCSAVDVARCANVTYDDGGHTSIVSEWRLICDESYKVSLCEALFMTGIFLGSYTTGAMSDHMGRRRSMFLCLALGATFATASAFSPNYWLYLALRTCCGVFLAGCQLTTFVAVTEIVGSSKRAACGTVFESALAVSTLLMSVTAYYVYDWRQLTLLTSCVGFLLLPLYFCIPESPRWLVSNRRYEDAHKVLSYIARKNGRYYEPIDLSHCAPATGGGGNQVGMLFRYRVLRHRTLIIMYAWVCILGTYYGLSMVAEDLRSSIYLNEFLLSVVELPGLAIAVLLMCKLGRKWSISASMLVSGASCLLIFILPNLWHHIDHRLMLDVKTALALLGKMSATVAMATSFIHTSELMPTTIRNSGLGLCTMMGRLGSIAAPFIAKLGLTYPHLEYIVFGGLAISAGALCLFLPETLNQPMPDTIEDALGHSAPLLGRKCETGKRRQKNGSLQAPLMAINHHEPLGNYPSI